MAHQYVSIDRIFAKFTRDITGDFSERDLIEQVGEALEAIGTPRLYEDHIAFMEVKDHQAPVPKWCHSITQIAKDNRWQGKKSNLFCPARIIPEIVAEAPASKPVPLDCKGQPITDYDVAYYRPYFDFKYGYKTLGESKTFRKQYTPVRLHETSFFSNKVTGQPNQDEYKIIQGNILRFNFRSGFVAVAYTRQAVDSVTGYPMVPDAFSHLTAITKYITMKKQEKDFYAGREGAKMRLDKAESDWQWYCGQASNNDKMPQGIDEYQNLLDQRTQLIPKNDRYFGFFGNLAQPQDDIWDYTPDDSEEEVIGQEVCDTNIAIPSTKIFNITNNTVVNSGNGGNSGGGSSYDPEFILITNEASKVVSWTLDRKTKYGAFPTVQVWLKDEYNNLNLSSIQPTVDAAPPNFTTMTFTFTGPENGFIKISK